VFLIFARLFPSAVGAIPSRADGFSIMLLHRESTQFDLALELCAILPREPFLARVDDVVADLRPDRGDMTRAIKSLNRRGIRIKRVGGRIALEIGCVSAARKLAEEYLDRIYSWERYEIP
jgi:hypothetical protein